MTRTQIINTVADALVDAISRSADTMRVKGLGHVSQALRRELVQSLYNMGHEGRWDGDEMVVILGYVRRK